MKLDLVATSKNFEGGEKRSLINVPVRFGSRTQPTTACLLHKLAEKTAIFKSPFR